MIFSLACLLLMLSSDVQTLYRRYDEVGGGVFVEECEARGGAAGSGDQTELVPQVRSLSFPASDLLKIHLKLLFFFLSSAAFTPAAEKQLKTVEKQCCDVE